MFSKSREKDPPKWFRDDEVCLLGVKIQKSFAWVSADQTTCAHSCRIGAYKCCGVRPPKAIKGRPLTSRVMGYGCLHLDFKEWTHPDLWYPNQTEDHREGEVEVSPLLAKCLLESCPQNPRPAEPPVCNFRQGSCRYTNSTHESCHLSHPRKAMGARRPQYSQNMLPSPHWAWQAEHLI